MSKGKQIREARAKIAAEINEKYPNWKSVMIDKYERALPETQEIMDFIHEKQLWLDAEIDKINRGE